MIAYKGRYQDADGWNFSDAEDGYNVMYKQVNEDFDYDQLESVSGQDFSTLFYAGYTMAHDILIFSFAIPHDRPDGAGPNFCISPFLVQHSRIYSDGGSDGTVTSDDCGAAGYSLSSNMFRHVVLHEIGHFIGLNHLKDPHAVMYGITDENTSHYDTVSYDDTDKQAFCCVYQCVTDKYRCNLDISSSF